MGDVEEIRFGPNPAWTTVSLFLEGAVFEGSNDNSAWTEIFAIDTTEVHASWNVWQKASGESHKYRYVRFKHTDVSSCELAEIEFIGIKYSTETVATGGDLTCDITIAASASPLTDAVAYKAASTSVVSGVSPAFGPSTGG